MRRLLQPRLLLSAILALQVSACARKDSAPGEKILVMVSILPYADFVEKVGGDRVEARVMIPPGASPATYEPTPRQIAELEKAKVYVKVGSGLPFEEVWLEKILPSKGDMILVDASGGIKVKAGDPHIWLSPALVKQQVDKIFRGLERIDPDNKDYYKRNLEGYLLELDSLDRDIREGLSGVFDRRFMIFHPSFGYFADDYGLEQIPIEEEGKEPTPHDLARLIENAKAANIKVIFAAPQFRKKDAEVIADSIGGRVEIIDPLARDYISNLRRVSKALKQGMEEK